MMITVGQSGFQMSFDNGWTVSIQFGSGNYCDNQYSKSVALKHCNNAEMAAWDRNAKWYRFEGDEVEGHASPERVAEFIHLVSQFSGDADAVNAAQEVYNEG